jgi:lipoprotein NlpD
MVALVALLGACGEAHIVSREPVYESPTYSAPAARHAGPGEIEVVRGDTLYGIAFRNGMDFRDLAAINGIEPPYTIYVGQILKLHGERVRVGTTAQTAPEPQPQAPARTTHEPAPTPFETVPQPPPPRVAAPEAATANASAPERTAVTAATPVRTLPAAPPASPPQAPPHLAPATSPPPPSPPTHPVATTAPPTVVTAPRVSPASQPVERTPSAAILPNVTAPSGGIGWRWPAKGSLIERFMAGDATKQGIDIAGNEGDPVLAAADGVVVYSGSGLVGYGELIIVKHSDEWLSAYGHNRKRLVAEGQRVRGGQAIAEMGRSGAPRDELHFEIRRNGRPVDPLQYLPSR